MVWDTTQSTLYTLSGAVERHNADLEATETAAMPHNADSAAIEPNTDRTKADMPQTTPAERSTSLGRDFMPELSPELYGQPAHKEHHSPHVPPSEPPPAPIRARTERIEAPCEKCTEAPKKPECAPDSCENCPHRCPKCGKPLPATQSSNPLEALLSDKDTLLLAGLILLLWHEKADIKLIGALAFILFSS